jgi:hypothetical protein
MLDLLAGVLVGAVVTVGVAIIGLRGIGGA